MGTVVRIYVPSHRLCGGHGGHDHRFDYHQLRCYPVDVKPRQCGTRLQKFLPHRLHLSGGLPRLLQHQSLATPQATTLITNLGGLRPKRKRPIPFHPLYHYKTPTHTTDRFAVVASLL